MTIINFTGDENRETEHEKLFCSAEISDRQNQLICFSALNILLSIVAFLGNTLILVALHKESSLHPPSKLLFRSLAETDLCVSIIVEPLAVVYWMFVVRRQWNMCRYTIFVLGVTGYTLVSVSLLISTAISVERLLALMLGLRYRQIVTLKRTYALITVFWVVSIVSLILRFFINPESAPYIICTAIVLCLVTSSYCYTKIFLTLHHREHQVQTNNVQRERSQTID